MSLAKLLKTGDEDSVKKLITSADFDVLQADNKTGETVYHQLVKYDFAQALKAFIQKTSALDPELRPNLEAKDKEGQTPLVAAITQGAEECCYALIAAGADVNAVYEKQSVLMLSAQVKKQRLHEMLLSKGADPNFTNSIGTAMHFAVEHDNEYLFESLLAHDATDFSLVSSKKQNILHATIAKNAVWALPSLLKVLQEKKVRQVFSAKDDKGKCPVHLAAQAMRENIVGLLNKAAAEVGLTEELLDSEGNSCADLVEQVEKANRELRNQAEREKEELKAKKAREKADQKAKEIQESLDLEKVKELARLQKVKEQVLEEEEAKKRPLKLLFVVAVIILILYLLLKIGVATGATKRAAESQGKPDL